MITCPKCAGAGYYEVDDGLATSHSVNQIFVEVRCPRCEGEGEIEAESEAE
jgi:DnaJ-class molecular chaperone